MWTSLLSKLKQFNDWFAIHLSKVYGHPMAIWTCIAFSAYGAFVSAETLAKMTYWSNAVQLVYCPLAIYVSGLLLIKHAQLHQKHNELARHVQEIHAAVVGAKAQKEDEHDTKES